MRKVLGIAVLVLPLALAGCVEHERAYYTAPPPPAFEHFGERGFHDGFEAARHDISRGRRFDVDAHGNFRNPPVPRRAIDEYRHGFRDGYERAFRGEDRRY